MELLRPMEPWPSSLMRKNPAKSIATLSTLLIQRQARPKRTTTAVVVLRWPSLSKTPPTRPMRRPAIRVPIEYMLETTVLLHPNSPMYESTKTETEIVWPGPEKNTVIAETATITHP